MPDIKESSRPADTEASIPADTGNLTRQQAIRQIERRRRFKINLVASGVGMIILAAIWATAEYHNAGGWPTQGFSQSSGIHDVWNYWIVYPLVAWILVIATHGWLVYGRNPISEGDIRREIERQSGKHR